MPVVNLVVSGKGQVKAQYDNFKLARNAWRTNFGALTNPEKNAALTTINNWGAANATQRIEALRVSMGFLYMVVAYLIYREFKS